MVRPQFFNQAVKFKNDVTIMNGKLGVGIENPAEKLEVLGGNIAVYDDGNNPRIILGDDGVDYGYLGWDSGNNYYRIETDGTNGIKLLGNNVAIGNIFPSQPLIVGNGATSLLRVQSSSITCEVVGTIGYQRNIIPQTGDMVLTTSQSYAMLTNESAVGTVTVTLPTAATGLTYDFYVQAAQELMILAGGGDTVRVAASVTAAAGNLKNSTVGGFINLTAINATEWVAGSVQGTWTVT